MRASRLAHSQRHEFRVRVPNQVIARVKEVSTPQQFETAQGLAYSNESRSCVDREMPLEVLR
jgi:hypothetical protein